jgi:hypothetical protein
MLRTAATFTLLFLIFINISSPVSPQETPAEANRYTLDGDNILIEVDESGARHLDAEGNVVLTYAMRNDVWTIHADTIEFVESVDDAGNPLTQTAHAQGNIVLNGNEITVTAPGVLDVDVMGRRMQSDSPDIRVQFPNGELDTEKLVIYEESPDAVVVETSVSTEATYIFSDTSEAQPGTEAERSGSIFSDLTFDFSRINIETESTRLEITNGEPVRLDCPDPTVVTSNDNKLKMPSSYILFNPPTLRANDGAELSIGENIIVHSDFLTLTYPESGGMDVVFTGMCAVNHDDQFANQRVTVTHPAGTFSSDVLEITVNDDGTHRIHASGCASFEIPISSIEGIPVEEEQ